MLTNKHGYPNEEPEFHHLTPMHPSHPWQRKSVVFIENHRNQFAVQVRPKDSEYYPGGYDLAVQDTTNPELSHELNAANALSTQLGINKDLSALRFIGEDYYSDDQIHATEAAKQLTVWGNIFHVKIDSSSDLLPDLLGEVDSDLKFMSKDEIRQHIKA